MLVLSRKKDESIVINNNIVITVIDVRGDKVRLGISAPKDVPVHREEVYEAIHGVKPPVIVPATGRDEAAGVIRPSTERKRRTYRRVARSLCRAY